MLGGGGGVGVGAMLPRECTPPHPHVFGLFVLEKVARLLLYVHSCPRVRTQQLTCTTGSNERTTMCGWEAHYGSHVRLVRPRGLCHARGDLGDDKTSGPGSVLGDLIW